MSFWDDIPSSWLKNDIPAKAAKWKEPMPAAAMTYFDKWVPAATRNKARYSHCITGSEMNFHVFICECGSNINIGQNQFAGIGSQIANNYAVPFALQEWVKEHRHVCDKFWIDPDWKNGSLSGKMCSTCGWNAEAHDQITVVAAEPELAKWQSQMVANAAKIKQKQLEAKIKAEALKPQEDQAGWVSYKFGFETAAKKPIYDKDQLAKLKANTPYGVTHYVAPVEVSVPVPEELPILEQPTGRKFRK